MIAVIVSLSGVVHFDPDEWDRMTDEQREAEIRRGLEEQGLRDLGLSYEVEYEAEGGE